MAKKRTLFFNRYILINEKVAKNNKDYEEAWRTYNQLRKYYEARSQSADAAFFYIGEMETKRKELSTSVNKRDRITSIIYLIAKLMTFYGESAALPLLLWSPFLIVVFGLVRHLYGICSGDDPCNIQNQMIDSLAAFLQFPRAAIPSDIDIIERAMSIPFLGIAIRSIAVKRRFDIFVRDT